MFLWAVTGAAALKAPVRRLMEQAEEIHVSSASVWEIAIKARLGKIKADPVALVDAIEESGFIELPV
ncbi:MAG TPA: PIN domain nuclease, partial [Ramlibacter sp.]|nr:PIN domain nuclease [Ramlibacter sp.]